jgi:hypothetical protein
MMGNDKKRDEIPEIHVIRSTGFNPRHIESIPRGSILSKNEHRTFSNGNGGSVDSWAVQMAFCAGVIAVSGKASSLGSTAINPPMSVEGLAGHVARSEGSLHW